MGQNIISVDVEEYFHAANLEPVIGPARWHAMESRVEYSTRSVIDIFAEHSVSATFFVLGSTARRHPQLVKALANAGHEIASHGYGHRLAYAQTERQFYRDVRRTKLLLEDLTGQPVIGYRAPNFSLTERTPWAYSLLIAAGYRYDSSRYPIRHHRYGNASKSVSAAIVHTENGNILVYPLAVHAARLLGREVRLPVAGGAYWRLLPKCYNKWGLSEIQRLRGEPFCCYFHPWELDAGQPRFRQLPALTRLRHYGGCASFSDTIRYFLRHFDFQSFRSVVGRVNPAQESPNNG